MDLNIAYSKNLTPFKPDYYEPSTNYSKDPINKNKNSCSTQYPSQNITNEIPKYKKLEKNLSRGSILNSVKSNIAKTINRSSSTITQTNSYTPRQTNSNNKDKNNYEDDNYNSILKTYRDFSKNTNKKNSTENFNNISCNYTNSNTNSSYLSKTINHQEDENRNCLKPEKKLRESIKNVIDLNLNIGRRKTDIGNNKTIDCDSRNLEILKIENIQNNNFHTLNKEDFYEESITNTGNRGNINRGLSPIPANFNPIQTSRAINNLITKNNSNKNFLEKIEKKNGSQLNLSPIDYETDTITINTEKSFIQDNKPFVNYSKPISFIKNISHGNNQNFNEENYFPEINCFKESNSNFSVKSLVNDIGNTHISNDHKDDEDLARKITSSGVINLNNLKDKIIPIKSNDFNYDNQISYNKNTKNSNYNNNIYNNEYENGIHSQRSSIISQESNHFNKEYLENFELKNNNFNNYKYSTDFSENIQPNPVRNQILDYNYIDYRQEYEKNINSLDNNLKKNGIYNNNSVLNNYNSNLNKSKSLLNETKKIINYSQGYHNNNNNNQIPSQNIKPNINHRNNILEDNKNNYIYSQNTHTSSKNPSNETNFLTENFIKTPFNPNNNDHNTKNFSFGKNNLPDNTFSLNKTKPFSPKEECIKTKPVDNVFIINIEDLLIIEEKLYEILIKINHGKICYHECFEWWNLYFNCSLCGNLENYFKDLQNKQIIREYTLIKMISISLCYDSCFNEEFFEGINYILKIILNLLHENFLILCDYFLSKISSQSKNVWVWKLQELIENNLKLKNLESEHVKEIKDNNQCILDYLKIVLKNYPCENISDLVNVFIKNMKKLSTVILNDFFRTKIIRMENKKASNLASCLIDSGENIADKIPFPYIKTLPHKELTLVLDLDETLIHLKIDIKDESTGLLRLRPGIYKFLDAVGEYYEIIIFTAATSEYANPILEVIEGQKKYFSHVFYREHTLVTEDDFVKDISRIGRDLSKMIIVDNMPQNFKLQKDNGILIKTFYGEDQNDKALLELIPILTDIGKNPNRDIRVSLAGYKDEIFRKVSSNLSRAKNI